jgi:hypothetical protein
VYKRFNEWSKKGKWWLLFKNLLSEPDTEWEFNDGSYVKFHQNSTGARGFDSQVIGKISAVNTKKFIWQSIVTVLPTEVNSDWRRHP